MERRRISADNRLRFGYKLQHGLKLFLLLGCYSQLLLRNFRSCPRKAGKEKRKVFLQFLQSFFTDQYTSYLQPTISMKIDSIESAIGGGSLVLGPHGLSDYILLDMNRVGG